MQYVTDIGNTTTNTVQVQDLQANGDIYVTYGGPASDLPSIYFYDGAPNGENITYDSANIRFTISDPVCIGGPLSWIDGSCAETINWDDGNGYFRMSDDVAITDDLAVEGNDINIGDVGGFSGIKFNPSSTELEFWIDGSKVSHIGTDGAYVDDVP